MQYYCKECFAKRYRMHRERKAASEGRVIRARQVVPDGFKYCPRCSQTLPITDFGSNRSARDGLTAYCRSCHNIVGRDTKIRLYGSTREYHLRRRYGLTSADVEAMVEAQGGVCAGCGGDPQHVDHDHGTGKVRGILCFNCNQALGNVRDDVRVLRRLISYLESHGCGRVAPVVELLWEVEPRFELAAPGHAA